jgi:O-antigen/teichoic acid export membrane protein
MAPRRRGVVRRQTTRLRLIVERVYEWAVKERMGPGAHALVSHLSSVALGSLAAYGVIFLGLTYAGRRLGPGEYGTYSVILAIANFLVIGMLGGFHVAAVKYLAEDPARTKEILSTALSAILALTLVSVGALYFAIGPLAAASRIEPRLFYYAAALGVALAVYIATESCLRGLNEMVRLARLRVAMGIAFALAVFVFLLRDRSFLTPVWATVIQYLAYAALVLRRVGLGPLVSPRFDRQELRRMARYSFYAVPGSFAGSVIADVDTLIINHYLAVEEVGVYSAYVLGANLIAVRAAGLLVTVFFPAAAGDRDKVRMARRLLALPRRVFLPLCAISGLIILTTVRVFGPDYPLRGSWVLLLAVSASLTFLASPRLWFLATVGHDGIKFASAHSMIAAVIAASTNWLLVPHVGTDGAIYASLLTSLYLFVASEALLRRAQRVAEIGGDDPRGDPG